MAENYKKKFDRASSLVEKLIKENNDKNELIEKLKAEKRELEETRYNPYHNPTNGRFTSPNSGSGGVLYVEKGKAGKGAYVFEQDFDDAEYAKWLANKIQAERTSRLQNLVSAGRKNAEQGGTNEPKKQASSSDANKTIKADKITKEIPKERLKKQLSTEELAKLRAETAAYYKNKLVELDRRKEENLKKYKSGEIDINAYNCTAASIADAQKLYSKSVQRYESETRELKDFSGVIIAVDFDNTLAFTRYPEILSPNYEVIDFVHNAKAGGATIILWTCRDGEALQAALEWCDNNNVPIDYVNENAPERVKIYGSDCRKISADIYIDDKAVSVEDVAAFV